MTDHLPECDYERQDYRGNDNRVCYCSRLRACEQRMLEDDVLAAAYHGEKGYAMGYAAALDAAEAAVAQLHTWVHPPEFDPEDGWWCVNCQAQAAIEALKEKP